MFVVIFVGEENIEVKAFGPFESFEVAHTAELELHKLAPFKVTEIRIIELKEKW